MKKINRTLLLLIFGHFLYSCGSFSEAGKVLRNEKSNNTDEFLVKKRDPLVLYDERWLNGLGTVYFQRHKSYGKIHG
jgi:hypothetical protein